MNFKVEHAIIAVLVLVLLYYVSSHQSLLSDLRGVPHKGNPQLKSVKDKHTYGGSIRCVWNQNAWEASFSRSQAPGCWTSSGNLTTGCARDKQNTGDRKWTCEGRERGHCAVGLDARFCSDPE